MDILGIPYGLLTDASHDTLVGLELTALDLQPFVLSGACVLPASAETSR